MQSDADTAYCERSFTKVFPEFLLAIIIGAIFSSTSRGFRNYVLFGLFYEIVYAAKIEGRYKPQNIIKRLAVFSAGLLTFLVVRISICDDEDPLRAEYGEAVSYSEIASAAIGNRPRSGNRVFGWRGRANRSEKYFLKWNRQ